MAIMQGAHRGNKAQLGGGRSVESAAELRVLGDAIRNLHDLASVLEIVEAKVCCSAGKIPILTSSTYAVAASPMIFAKLVYCLTKRCIRPRLSPTMSCQTKTCASQSGPAPMPTVGISSSAVTCLAR